MVSGTKDWPDVRRDGFGWADSPPFPLDADSFVGGDWTLADVLSYRAVVCAAKSVTCQACGADVEAAWWAVWSVRYGNGAFRASEGVDAGL